LIKTIFKSALIEDDPGLRVLDHKVRRVEFKKHRIIKSKLSNREKIFTNRKNTKELV